YNMSSGQVEVVTRTRDSRAAVSVANTGPTIPAAVVGTLFQPFQRLTAERTSRCDGLGLGLSIVQAIAHAHNATITARPHPGGGLIVEVTFPDPLGGPPAARTCANPHTEFTFPALTSATAAEQADRRPGSRGDESRRTSA